MSMLKALKSKRLTELRSQQNVQCRDQLIPITIIRSRRRRRKLSLQVGRSGVVLRAPFTTPATDIDMMLSRHRDWIYERQQLLLKQQGSVLRYESGEQHDYLGESLELVIVAGSGRLTVERGDACLILRGDAGDAAHISRTLQQWYLRQAQQLFAARLSLWAARLPWVEGAPELRLRRMRSRWGSCSAGGRICLNTHLVKASQNCIDYVIVHELCHLQEFNHSPRFYALMAAAMPEWRQYKAELESVGARIVRE
ncbi:MAG: putative metal-dependent hydrolase [Zhongshania sp.]|jgi:predicted metal-dependent hydrolase|nr:M48 family metallopeptidase [Zhongshania sp.]